MKRNPYKQYPLEELLKEYNKLGAKDKSEPDQEVQLMVKAIRRKIHATRNRGSLADRMLFWRKRLKPVSPRLDPRTGHALAIDKLEARRERRRRADMRTRAEKRKEGNRLRSSRGGKTWKQWFQWVELPRRRKEEHEAH